MLKIEFAFLCWLTSALRKKCPNTEFFLVLIFLYSGWMRRFTPEISVFSPNVGKYGPEKTPWHFSRCGDKTYSQITFNFGLLSLKTIYSWNFLSFSDGKSFLIFNPLSANSRKWSNALKQFISKLSTSCLCLFDYFVGWALKGLREGSLMHKVLIYRQICKTYIKSKYLHT